MIFWILVCIGALLFDVFTASLLSIWFTVGGIAAIIINLLGFSPLFQVIVFVLVSVAGLIFGYPFVKNLVRTTVPKFKSLEQSNVGQTISCKEDIINGEGRIYLNGAYWRVKEENNETILIGENFKIVELKGNIYIVKKVSSTLSTM